MSDNIKEIPTPKEFSELTATNYGCDVAIPNLEWTPVVMPDDAFPEDRGGKGGDSTKVPRKRLVVRNRALRHIGMELSRIREFLEKKGTLIVLLLLVTSLFLTGCGRCHCGTPIVKESGVVVSATVKTDSVEYVMRVPNKVSASATVAPCQCKRGHGLSFTEGNYGWIVRWCVGLVFGLVALCLLFSLLKKLLDHWIKVWQANSEAKWKEKEERRKLEDERTRLQNAKYRLKQREIEARISLQELRAKAEVEEWEKRCEHRRKLDMESARLRSAYLEKMAELAKVKNVWVETKKDGCGKAVEEEKLEWSIFSDGISTTDVGQESPANAESKTL